MIHLAGPVLLVAVLAGAGVYGIIARRNAVLVLIGAELLLAAAGVLFVLGSALPAGGLIAQAAGAPELSARMGDPLVSGQVATIMLITIAAAEIGLALAVVLLLFRARATSDLTVVRELGEASPTYTDHPSVAPRTTEDVS
ncbi:MAG: NADH-quinone oxidoreductase subunit K [Kineosporiaceae bacterium]